MKHNTKQISVLLLSGLLAVLLALAPVSSVMAKAAPQETIDDKLSKAFAAEKTWLDKQQTAIEKSDKVVTKVEEFIDKAAAKGLDVTVLENALAAFTAAMPAVRTEHQNADSILSAHAGFDANGEVTDRPAARETVKDARRALGEAHMTMTQAFWALRDAVEEWKDANFPQGA